MSLLVNRRTGFARQNLYEKHVASFLTAVLASKIPFKPFSVESIGDLKKIPGSPVRFLNDSGNSEYAVVLYSSSHSKLKEVNNANYDKKEDQQLSVSDQTRCVFHQLFHLLFNFLILLDFLT